MQLQNLRKYLRALTHKYASTFYLTSPATAPEKSLMSTHFYSCRQLLGLQVQRFVEQQKVSLKWNHPRFIELREEEVKDIPLKQPCNYDTRSLLCPQHTQYSCQMYRCTSSAKR